MFSLNRQLSGILAVAWGLGALSAAAGEPPYFVTYSHLMEEPGNLEIAFDQAIARPAGGDRFLSHVTELEYGATAWWTSELYLTGQLTARQGALYTGYRWENRFRPLMNEHWINPVLYLEFENISAADKSLREIVGHDGTSDQLESNGEARLEHEHEIEGKLILSSNLRGWNISENVIAEKNLANEPWEFGYAAAVSRPLVLAASPRHCRLCGENFSAGLELYGGLGTRHDFGLRDTSHYLAPTAAWSIPGGPTIKASPGFGLTASSYGMLLRFTVAYEVRQFGRMFRRKE